MNQISPIDSLLAFKPNSVANFETNENLFWRKLKGVSRFNVLHNENESIITITLHIGV